MAAPNILTAEEIDAALTSLSDWKRDGGAIAASYALPSFRDALAFLVRVGFEAEAMNHHPEIANVYNRVWFKLNTHDAGGAVTDRDIALARQISGVARAFLDRR